MDTIKIPLLLKGTWDHLFIMTFGADLPFFERSLLPQLSARCRNKVILCDGRQFISECTTYARNSSLVRHFNRTYVAEGIFPFISHAKVILLVNKDQGRLLVGSGNLNVDGYAGGGELFTQYEFSRDAPENLNAFLAIQEIMNWLIKSQTHMSRQVSRQIRLLLDETPWLSTTLIDGNQPVRTNISVSFIDQIIAELDGYPVEELWVLSPFYDEKALALQELLHKLKPSSVKLFVQKRYTSVDGNILHELCTNYSSQISIHPFTPNMDDEQNGYVHAKLYLIKLHETAICLQGSPNLSQVAMLRGVGKGGNLEIGNLLKGKRDEFDYIFDRLTIFDSVIDISELELKYHSEDATEGIDTSIFFLKNSEFEGNQLRVGIGGDLPNLETVTLLIDGKQVPYESITLTNDGLIFTLTYDLTPLLSRPCSITLQFGNGQVCNPVFPINRKALQEHLRQDSVGEHLPSIGSLESNDSDLEGLLRELETILIIDEVSVWNVLRRNTAGRLPDTLDDNENVLRMRDVDIDVSVLRKHPHMRQYARWGSSSLIEIDDTPLRIIMNAISKHFSDLIKGQTSEPVALEELVNLLSNIDDFADVQTEDEIEETEREVSKSRVSGEQGLRRRWKNFITRYIGGTGSKKFHELVGFEVMIQNYHIFSHILWQLFSKEWFEQEAVFVGETISQLMKYFWGDIDYPGYFSHLDKEEWSYAHTFMIENHTYEIVVASCFQCANLIFNQKWTNEKLVFQLRDCFQNLLRNPLRTKDKEFMENIWLYVAELPIYPSPMPLQIVHQLIHLARYNTDRGFFDYIEKQYGYRASNCQIMRVNLHNRKNVECVVITDETALSSIDEVHDILKKWMLFYSAESYRIHCVKNGQVLRLAQYDTQNPHSRFFHDRETDKEIMLTQIEPLDIDWGKSLLFLEQIATQVTEEIQVSIENIDVK